MNIIKNQMNSMYNLVRKYLFSFKSQDSMKVIVVGLPRSGTSFLTGLIVRMGFDPGPKKLLRSANQFNPYGYYENMKLMKIDHDLLKKFGGKVMNPPELPKDWIKLCIKEQKKIRQVVDREGIEIYKGNMLVILADLYDVLFPNVKWIYISRNEDDIVRSLIAADNENMLDKKFLYELITYWKRSWYKNKISKNCLEVRYEDFFESPEKTIRLIAKYLNHSMSKKEYKVSLDFFQPN